nr:sensor histidine kinase [Saccharomonospora saliphila]
MLLGLGVVTGAVAMTVLVNSMGALAFGAAPALAEQFAWAVGITAPLVVRRRYPLAVVLVVGAVFIAAQVRQNGDNLVPSIALFLALYTAGAWGRDRVRARRVRVLVVVAMFAWLTVSLVRSLVTPTPAPPEAGGPLDPVLSAVLYSVGFNLLFFLSGYFFGDQAWLSARRRAELEHATERLRRSQEENTRNAIVAERVRIARDLHDIVAHHVSVMGIQAGAARRVFDTDRDLARGAIDTVESTARTVIEELRGLLGILRSEPDEDGEPAGDRTRADGTHPSSAGLDQIPELVASARATGLEVHYGVYGDTSDADRPVPDAVALSVYRVVQEALTNIVRHAGARSADVRVRHRGREVEVEVTDDGRGPGAPGSSTGTGLGLLGMRERVAVHGGTLETGPRRGGGYRVRASLPVATPQDGPARTATPEEDHG